MQQTINPWPPVRIKPHCFVYLTPCTVYNKVKIWAHLFQYCWNTFKHPYEASFVRCLLQTVPPLTLYFLSEIIQHYGGSVWTGSAQWHVAGICAAILPVLEWLLKWQKQFFFSSFALTKWRCDFLRLSENIHTYFNKPICFSVDECPQGLWACAKC